MLQLIKLIKALNSDSSPAALASAVCLALIIGLTPFSSPHNLLVLLIVLLFRVHFGTFVMASFGFGLLGLTIESLLDNFGYYLLTHETYAGLWTALYNTQIGRLSFFNYTTQFGGLILSLLLFVPLWLGSVWSIKQYRVKFQAWAQDSKIMAILRGSTLFSVYDRSSGGES